MTHQTDVFDSVLIQDVNNDESAIDALVRWKARKLEMFGEIDYSESTLRDLRFIDFWRSQLEITIYSTDDSKGSLKQMMHDCTRIAFFATELYERVRHELNEYEAS